jgi:hypothetical protein
MLQKLEISLQLADKLYVMPMLTFREERLDSEALYQSSLMYYQSTNRDSKDDEQ